MVRVPGFFLVIALGIATESPKCVCMWVAGLAVESPAPTASGQRPELFF